MNTFNEIIKLVKASKGTVILTGAGISTESGLPDFRSDNGFWTKNKPIQFNEFLQSEAKQRLSWERNIELHSLLKNIKPNLGHMFVEKITSLQNNNFLITQNIDGLHQKSGIPKNKIIEIHGSAVEAACLECAAKQNILSLVQSGIDQGAELVVDGRDFSLQGYEDGFFVGAHLFDRVTPEMDIYKKEIFGPVLSTVRAGSYEEAIGLAMDHEYGNGTAIFTRDGDTARDFANRINIGMVGVNVPIPVPLAYHTFGGWKKSVFGDLNQHGPDAFKFYTRTKTVTSRWPSGIKEGGEFNFKAMD